MAGGVGFKGTARSSDHLAVGAPESERSSAPRATGLRSMRKSRRPSQVPVPERMPGPIGSQLPAVFGAGPEGQSLRPSVLMRTASAAVVPPRPTPVPPHIQRCGGVDCPPGTCDHDQTERVHRSGDGTRGPAGIPAIVARVLRTPGRALDGATRADAEGRFGQDFRHVRVHIDGQAAQSARAIHAQAYTFGRHIVMGEGRYQPGTAPGMRLLVHELTHVVQQGNQTADPAGAHAVSQSDDLWEQEADHEAGRLTGARTPAAPPGLLQRQDDDDTPFSGGGGMSGGGGSSGSYGPPADGAPVSRPVPIVCSRPLDFPGWTGLRNFRHAFINDPPANYAIRGLRSGNGVTTSCSTATDASPAPDVPMTSTCKPCLPPPGQTPDDVSSCLRNTHAAYPSPNLYRNLPDPSDGWRHGPNSNSYAATMARCCDRFDPAGLGTLPGWDHSPAGPCPDTVVASGGPGPQASDDGGTGPGPADAGPSTPIPDAGGLPPGGTGPGTSTPDAGQAQGGAQPALAAAAVPVNLEQILTGWVGGKDKYGFQLKFRCGSSSGSVADLQAQAPNLVWREYVTYSRNDFAHRINPPNPTILPPGGVSFSAASTTVISKNVLEFKGVTDTHWTPTSAVRQSDFPPTGTHTFPAIMESSQLYQFTTDGSTWTSFAGPFTLRRTFDRMAGPPAPGAPSPYRDQFTTDKVGIHALTEAYKP
jgi:Domain of unknown function (DUF4157)